MGETTRFGFKTLDEGDQISDDSYKFSDADRHQIDRILAWFEHHHHTGEAGATTSPVAGPELELDTEGGNIPAGSRVRYRYTLVDATGLETAASPESYLDTPEPIDVPEAAALSVLTVGGSLIPGQYYYVLSAYQDFSTSETQAQNPAHITVPATTNTNEVTLELPDLPFGATGFNIYRRSPGGTRYFYLDSVDMDVATPPTDYIDDGSVDEDCDRTLPASNTTFSTNAITVSIGGATPSVPAGYTWKLYRTYEAGNYDDSLLVWIVEETFEGSEIITPLYDDIGGGTTTGTPPTANQTVDQPDQIQLTDVEEVQGYLPPGRNIVAITLPFPREVLDQGEGSEVWCCDYERAQVIGARIVAQRDESPFNTDVIIDVERFNADLATPVWQSLYPTSTKPTLELGSSIGDRYVPDLKLLTEGDLLSTNVLQVDGDPDTDDNFVSDVLVQVYLMVQHQDQDVSWTWATS